MPASNTLIGAPAGAYADPPLFGPGGAADRHPFTGGAGATTRGNSPLTLAIIVLGCVALLGALDLGGFRSTITIGRS